MADLVERLRARLAAEKAVRETGHNAADREQAALIRLLTDAAAALAAAPEDAKRWRFIREQTPTTIRLDGNMRGSGLPAGLSPSYYHADTADELDAAIDQARGVAASG